VAVNSADGPASIEGFYDEAISLAGMLAVIRERKDFDAVVIACFDDTGLDAARCLTDKPVIGIGEAAYHMASMISNKFSVVTTLARSVPALEHNLHRYGLIARCARVRSSEVAVLELELPGSDACNRISAEIGRAIAEDRAEAIVLGCAGMADLADALAKEHGLPVLDGVSCAVGLAEAMVRLRILTSRVGGYSPPPVSKLMQV
jgi:allantoin racemase